MPAACDTVSLNERLGINTAKLEHALVEIQVDDSNIIHRVLLSTHTDKITVEWSAAHDVDCGHSPRRYGRSMSEAAAKLRSAIEQSYREFAGMPCPRTLDTSRLRDSDEILQALTSAPLRELGGEQIGPYSGWAITTVGNDRDYRHFLPRIFEIAITDPVWLGTEPPVMASRLNMSTWRSWPAEQQSAVLRVFQAAFDAMVERHPDDWPSEADNWFCGIANLGEPVTPPFQRWRSSTSANAALNMASFILSESKNLRQNAEVRGPFWEEVSEDVRRDVAKLLLEERTMVFLQSAANRVSEEDRFYHLDAAIADLARQF